MGAVVLQSSFCCSVPKSCPSLFDATDCSTPGFSVLHHHPESAQTHIHRISDAVQPSHPQPPPSPPVSNLSQHQGLFQQVSSSLSGDQNIGISASTSVLPKNIQDWFPLGWTGWITLQSKGLSSVFSDSTVQNHQFFGAQVSSQNNLHIHIWPLEKP